jgi:chromosomal replication initiator protein
MSAGKRSAPPTSTPSPPARLWEDALPLIRSRVGDTNFASWIEPLRVCSGNAVALAAPNTTVHSLVSRHFLPLINDVLSKVAGRPCTASVVVQPAIAPPPAAAPAPAPRAPAPLSANYTFERFVVGESNAAAFRHALAVAEGHPTGAEPLVLYGGVGVGKSHLGAAIGNAFRAAGPERRLLCGPCTDFVERLTAAMHSQAEDTFRAELAQVELLILDDVQFMEGQVAVQDELVRIFAHLHERGTPVVLTSDRPPQELSDLEQGLQRRFADGVHTFVGAPELDLRRRILVHKAAEQNVRLPAEVAELVATRVTDSVRSLEGALTYLIAHAAARGVPLTCALATEALRALAPPAVPITTELVRAVVCASFGLTQRALLSQRRTRNVTLPRQLAMYLCRKHCLAPLNQIAEAFGRRDHSTVLYACETIDEKLRGDHALQLRLKQLEELIMQRARSHAG